MRSLFFLASLGLAAAETGIDAWLRYAPVSLPSTYSKNSLPQHIVVLNATAGSPLYTAGQELQKGLLGILDQSADICTSNASGPSVVVGTVAEYTKLYGALESAPALEPDGFWLDTTGSTVQILGQDERGALYGAFEYLSMLAQVRMNLLAPR